MFTSFNHSSLNKGILIGCWAKKKSVPEIEDDFVYCCCRKFGMLYKYIKGRPLSDYFQHHVPLICLSS